MNKLILTLTTMLAFMFGVSFVQAAGVDGEVEQISDCRTVKANAVHSVLDVEALFKTCINLKIQNCDREMLTSVDLAEAQFVPGQEAELSKILDDINYQHKDCKSKIK